MAWKWVALRPMMIAVHIIDASALRRPAFAGLALLTALGLGACSSGDGKSGDTKGGSSSAKGSSAQGSSSDGGGTSDGGQTDESSDGSRPAGKDTPVGGASWKTQKVSVGRRVDTEFTGPASGVTMKVRVWLPPQYDDPANAGKTFPVIEAFPGGSGVSGSVWMNMGQPKMIEKGVAAGTTTPFILVEPQMQLSESKDTECTDLDGQPKIGTFLDTDVPNLVKKSFNAATAKSAWGTAGVSSGAYCAVRVAMHKPDTFSAAASMDGYFRIDSNLAAGKTAAAKATSPLTLAASAPAVAIMSWYGTGHNNGQLSKERSQEFAKAVKPPTTYTQKEIPGGAHSWDVYTRLMPEMFEWFTGKLDKPA